MSNKILQISAGRGPAECCWVVAQVLKKVMRDARENDLKIEILEREKGPENGTLYSALILLKGATAQAFVTEWAGTIQWVGKSTFRKYHKRQNWFVGVKEVTLDSGFDIDEKDIRYQAQRSGGPGGQHVNKVSSAIRATHIPSGVTVVASDTRSQLQNKKQAKARLIALCQQKRLDSKNIQIQETWQNHNELERGNPVKKFKGKDFKIAQR